MPRKEVKSLYNLTLPTVVQNLRMTIDLHLESCEVCKSPLNIEKCTKMAVIKDSLNIPSSLLCATFKKIASDNIETDSMYYYCWLLKNPELLFPFTFQKSNDNHFITKYGKYIRMIDFDMQPILFKGEFWSKVLFCVRNIQVLNLYRCKTTAEVLEHVGRECVQIRKIEGLDDIIKSDVTVEKFRKLIFRTFQNGEIKNECCNTLEKFDLPDSAFSTSVSQELVHIVTMFLKNMPKLKFFGANFCVDFYLRSLVDSVENIVETNIIKVYTFELMTSEILPLLKKLSPKLKNLNIFRGIEDNLDETLNNYFPNLEKLYLEPHENQEEAELYKIVTTAVWPKLKRVIINSINMDIELSDFAENLPSLEILHLEGCKVNWNRKVHFKCLIKSKFQLVDVKEIFWIAAFASTITELHLSASDYTARSFNEDVCSPLLNVPLPKLQTLSLNNLEYNFDYLTKVISTLPSLTTMSLFHLLENNQLKDVQQFVNDNNYECNFTYYLDF